MRNHRRSLALSLSRSLALICPFVVAAPSFAQAQPGPWVISYQCSGSETSNEFDLSGNPYTVTGTPTQPSTVIYAYNHMISPNQGPRQVSASLTETVDVHVVNTAPNPPDHVWLSVQNQAQLAADVAYANLSLDDGLGDTQVSQTAQMDTKLVYVSLNKGVGDVTYTLSANASSLNVPVSYIAVNVGVSAQIDPFGLDLVVSPSPTYLAIGDPPYPVVVDNNGQYDTLKANMGLISVSDSNGVVTLQGTGTIGASTFNMGGASEISLTNLFPDTPSDPQDAYYGPSPVNRPFGRQLTMTVGQLAGAELGSFSNNQIIIGGASGINMMQNVTSKLNYSIDWHYPMENIVSSAEPTLVLNGGPDAGTYNNPLIEYQVMASCNNTAPGSGIRPWIINYPESSTFTSGVSVSVNLLGTVLDIVEILSDDLPTFPPLTVNYTPAKGGVVAQVPAQCTAYQLALSSDQIDLMQFNQYGATGFEGVGEALGEQCSAVATAQDSWEIVDVPAGISLYGYKGLYPYGTVLRLWQKETGL